MESVMIRLRACGVSSIAVAAVAVVLSMAGVRAQTPAALPSGQASGTLTVAGKPIKLAFAGAWVPSDDATGLTLLLTDLATPPDVLSGKTSVMMSQMMTKAPFSGLEITLDAKRQIVSAYLYEKDERTATSGLFELKFDAPTGKALTGTIKTTAAAAKLKAPMALDGRFSATLK
jgi:hypothetical protein